MMAFNSLIDLNAVTVRNLLLMMICSCSRITGKEKWNSIHWRRRNGKSRKPWSLETRKPFTTMFWIWVFLQELLMFWENPGGEAMISWMLEQMKKDRSTCHQVRSWRDGRTIRGGRLLRCDSWVQNVAKWESPTMIGLHLKLQLVERDQINQKKSKPTEHSSFLCRPSRLAGGFLIGWMHRVNPTSPMMRPTLKLQPAGNWNLEAPALILEILIRIQWKHSRRVNSKSMKWVLEPRRVCWENLWSPPHKMMWIHLCTGTRSIVEKCSQQTISHVI